VNYTFLKPFQLILFKPQKVGAFVSGIAMSPAPQKMPPQPAVVHSDIAGAEKRLHTLKSAFGAVSAKWDRRFNAQELFRLAIVFAVVAAGTFAFVWYLLSSPWPVGVTLKHLAAFPNCEAAEMVGLAPARRGQPGYWKRNDTHGEGISCKESKWRIRHLIVPS
jgi:hypothetical protein